MAAARARAELAPAPPRNDAYTALLLISLVAMLAGTLLLFLDYSRYPSGKPPQPPGRTAAPANVPASPPTAAPPAPAAPNPAAGGAPAPAPGGNPPAPEPKPR